MTSEREFSDLNHVSLLVRDMIETMTKEYMDKGQPICTFGCNKVT